MTTRLTDQVLANVHGDMRAGADLDPTENQLIAEVLNRMDEATVDGYDPDAAAAGLFAFASVLRSAQFEAAEDATPEDIVQYFATMAAYTGQALHAQTHVVAEAPEPQRARPYAAVVQAVMEHDAIPWPPDRRERIPLAIVGALPTAYQLEALRQFRSARGLPTLISISGLTAAEVNRAVTWWNHRAAMLSMEQPR